MAEKLRVLVVATHPIQYQVPWFQALTTNACLDVAVLFVQIPDALQQGTGFGVAFNWDIPLLSGYRWQQASGVRGRGGLKGFFSTHLSRPSKLLREMAPSVVLLTGWHAWPLLQVLLAARLRGIPVIMRGESNALRERSLLARAFHRSILAMCSAFLTIGKANRDFYRHYGVPDSRMFETPYFVDNARFVDAAVRFAPRRGELRASWSIPGDAICFCFAGKLQPKKCILDLLAALCAMKEHPGKPVHLLIVGTGEQLSEAQSYAAEHGLPVTFAGFLNQTEIPSAYVAADCLVLPSDYGETWGLVVNEAMACGRPAIVSDRVGCARDLVHEGVTGAQFPFGDIDTLARKMLEMSADPGLVHAMGIQARDRVLGRYSVGTAVEGTLNAVRFVCGIS